MLAQGVVFSKKDLKSANQFSVPGKSQHYFSSIIVLISKYGAAVKSCGQNIHLQHEKYQNSLTSLVPSFINPFIPGNFGDKFLLTVVWSLLCYKELQLTVKPFTCRTLCDLLILMQIISLRSSAMHRKQKLENSPTRQG